MQWQLIVLLLAALNNSSGLASCSRHPLSRMIQGGRVPRRCPLTGCLPFLRHQPGTRRAAEVSLRDLKIITRRRYFNVTVSYMDDDRPLSDGCCLPPGGLGPESVAILHQRLV